MVCLSVFVCMCLFVLRVTWCSTLELIQNQLYMTQAVFISFNTSDEVLVELYWGAHTSQQPFTAVCAPKRREKYKPLQTRWNTKSRPDHRQLRLAPVSVSNDMPLFLMVCLLRSRGSHLESVRGRTRREKWKFDYFQSQARGDKRLVAHHQAEPAVVVSVGKDVQKSRHPLWGERALLRGSVIMSRVWRYLKGFHQRRAWDEKWKNVARKMSNKLFLLGFGCVEESWCERDWDFDKTYWVIMLFQCFCRCFDWVGSLKLGADYIFGDERENPSISRGVKMRWDRSGWSAEYHQVFPKAGNKRSDAVQMMSRPETEPILELLDSQWLGDRKQVWFCTDTGTFSAHLDVETPKHMSSKSASNALRMA